MWRYEVLVDIYEDNPDWEDKKDLYFKVAERHNALKIGHEKTRNSSLLFTSEKKLTRKDLEKELEGIKVLGFGKEKLRKTA